MRPTKPSASPTVGVSRGLMLARHWQTVVVAGYALATFSWTVPAELFPPKDVVGRVSRPALQLFGLWQSWEMFAPDPRREDIRVEVRFIDRDGSSHRLMLTAMETMGYFERMQRERWRKFFNDHLRLDQERFLWQPFTEFMGRALCEEGQEPVVIELVRWWRLAEPRIAPELRPERRNGGWHSHIFHRWGAAGESSR